MRGTRKVTPNVAERMKELLLSGKTVGQTASILGISRGSVYFWGAKMNLSFIKSCRKDLSVRIPNSHTDLAYIAGIVDGEGSISRVKGKKSWRICVYNTDLGLIDWLVSFGGKFYVRPEMTCGFKTKKTQYGWQVQRRVDVFELLTAVLPYLRIKKQKAVDAISEMGEWLRTVEYKH